MKKLYILLALAIFSFAALQIAVPSVAEASAGNCYAYASKQCISNISYWYDSCGGIQAIAQNCNNTNQVCSNGYCVNKTGTTTNYTNDNNNNQYNPQTNYQPQTYIQNYRTACYNNNIFWYDSNSVVQSMSQSCSDSNSCTIDSCSSNKCNNILKCDGSTCAVNSADYMAHCTTGGQTTTQNTQNTQNTTTTTTTTNNNNGQVAGAQTASGVLAITMFAAKATTPTEWLKSLNAVNGDNLNFVIIVKNTSATPVNNTIVQANLTNNISYTGNFKIDNTTSAGSITSGIDVGTLPGDTSKIISFTGTVQSQNVQTIQVSSNVNTTGMSDSDYVTINTPAGSTATAAVSGTGFTDFVKKWYLWALIIIVLLILFVIIFRRLSTSA
jgi:hypothetical protein